DGVVARARPGRNLEALAQHAAGDRCARIDREARRGQGEVTRRVVDARLLLQVVEGLGAQRLPRHELAELLVVLVHGERLEVRQPEVALDVADAALAARAEPHALEPAAPGLRRDVDDAVAGAR